MIFIDTWAWRARILAGKDKWFGRARTSWDRIIESRQRLLTTWMVVDETINAVAKRINTAQAAEIYYGIIDTPALTFQPYDREIYTPALSRMRVGRDRQYGITDAVSFATMQRFNCRVAFTGDSDFKQAGFEIIPD